MIKVWRSICRCRCGVS